MVNEAEEWEPVHTVHDYWDAPISGTADFGGAPHAFQRIFDEAEDEWSDECWVGPITAEQLRLVQENEAMFRRWRQAHDAGGLAPDEKDFVLASDRPRHGEIAEAVKGATVIDPRRAARVHATFAGVDYPPTQFGAWKVRWSAVK